MLLDVAGSGKTKFIDKSSSPKSRREKLSHTDVSGGQGLILAEMIVTNHHVMEHFETGAGGECFCTKGGRKRGSGGIDVGANKFEGKLRVAGHGVGVRGKGFTQTRRKRSRWKKWEVTSV